MSEAKFTKGDWKVAIHQSDYTSRMIVITGGFGGFDISNCDNAEKNAHLIAAAPEMYEMLEKIAKSTVHDRNYATAKPIFDLLAKARGEL